MGKNWKFRLPPLSKKVHILNCGLFDFWHWTLQTPFWTFFFKGSSRTITIIHVMHYTDCLMQNTVNSQAKFNCLIKRTNNKFIVKSNVHRCLTDLVLDFGVLPKKNSILKDIIQIGGREVNPISKNWKEMIFNKNWRGRGSQNILSKKRSTLFCKIHYSIWPNQGTLCLSFCTPDPQKVHRDNRECKFKCPKFHNFCQKF